MKVGISGNYGHKNIGDESILQGLINQIYTISTDSEIVIFSDDPVDTSERYGLKSYKHTVKKGNKFLSLIYTLANVYKHIKDLDVIIIGGGQLVMDLYKRVPFLYSMYAVLGKLLGKKVIYYSVGAGPISTPIGKLIIGLGLKCASFISVRDYESKKLLDELYNFKNKVLVTADPAFFVNNPSDENKKNDKKTIGFTTLPYYNRVYWPSDDKVRYNRYLNLLHEIIEEIIKNTDCQIVFFSTKYPSDTISSTDLYNMVSDKTRVINDTRALSLPELLQVINNCDLIVGTRLHSLILSLVCNKPIIGINYQPKVRSLFKRVELENYCFDIDTKDSQKISKIIKDIMADEESYNNAKANAIKALNTMKKESEESLKKLTTILKNAD